MNKERELNKEDWRRIRNAMDLYLRCQLGQLKDAFEIFKWEFDQRLQKDSEVTPSEREERVARLRTVLERAEKEIGMAAFNSTSTSFGVKGLDDPIRQLIIQADLHCCNFHDDLSQCPAYPHNCCAPTTGWCPKKLSNPVLPYPSTDINKGKFAVVGSHPGLGSGILAWNKTQEQAWANSYAINDAGGKARVQTKEEALSDKKEE